MHMRLASVTVDGKVYLVKESDLKLPPRQLVEKAVAGPWSTVAEADEVAKRMSNPGEAVNQPNRVQQVLQMIRDLNLRAYERTSEPFPVPAGTRARPMPGSSGLTVNTVPGMGSEGHAVGRNIYVGPDADYARMAHEQVHVDQMGRYGPMYDVLYRFLANRLARQGRPSYMEHPFEKEAMQVEQNIHSASRKSRR